jgi:hypothetical protein
MISFVFKPEKILQSIYAISKISKEPLSLRKILNILYLSDRTALIEYGTTITGASVYNYRDMIPRISSAEKVALDFLTFTNGQMDDPGDGNLSDYDVELFERCCLIKTPEYPESTLENSVCGPISYEDILKAHGVSDEIINEYVLMNIHQNSIRKDFEA